MLFYKYLRYFYDVDYVDYVKYLYCVLIIANRQSDLQNRTEGNVSFLQSGRLSFNKIEPQNLLEIKQYLASKKIPCRI